MTKKFVDKITGLCAVYVEGRKGSWNVFMTVTYMKDGREEFTEGAVRPLPAASPWQRGEEIPTEFATFPDREQARRSRERVLMRMHNGEAVYVETVDGISPIYAVRDFDWKGVIPQRLKVRARRKNAA